MRDNGRHRSMDRAHINGTFQPASGYDQPFVNDHADGAARNDLGGRGGDIDRSTVEQIAIIGMGMRLPGGVHDASGFWDLLVNGRNGRCEVPANRYAIDAWYGPGQPLHIGTRWGNFLRDYNPAHIDTSFWSMSKEEAETMDPEQRLLLEVVYEAFESSGRRDFRGDEVGVYVGTMGTDWERIEQNDNLNLEPVRADIYGDYILANRVSYEFDLKGPSIVLRTACSSSISALHMACQDIRSGECTSAMVCGTNLIIHPRDTALMTEQGVLSPSGSSRTFDADADGYGRGEAVNAILVKKLSDAVRDNDPIRAVIRNTCISGDGKTPGLTVPNPSSHEKLIRRAYDAAGIGDLSTVAMVECHGTGTAVGDPIEIEAIANVWGEHGIHIGSVKPNIGHGEGASGLSSIIKMVLALENRTIPPNINFNTPNPRIPWEKAKLTVPTNAIPWPVGRLERVSINSFGIGGANAHVILESSTCNSVNAAPGHGSDLPRNPPEGWQYLLPFSAKSQHSLLKRVEHINSYLSKNPQSLCDLAYSLSVRRESHCFRAFSIISNPVEAGDAPIVNKVPTDVPQLIWVFTGQGAQWARMGKELIEKVPLAGQRLKELQNILDDLPKPPTWTLKDALFAPQEKSQLYEAEFSQPCLAAIQIILVDLLRSCRVGPAAVVGHSSGETGAGYAANVITAKDAMILAYHRGQITPPLKAAHRGGMAAVGMGREEVEPYLRTGVIVGCENSPSNVSLSGDSDVLERVMEDIRHKRPEVLCRPLQVECGYHSLAHMFAIRGNFDARVAGIAIGRQPRVPFYSSVTGNLNVDFPRSYWSTNMVSPVLFSTAVETLLSDFPSATFIELGPHSAMSGPLRQILQKNNRTADYIPTLVRNMDGHASILRAAGQLWAKGYKIDLNTLNARGRLLTNLPTYPWHYDAEYWMEGRVSRDWRFRRFRQHELLGIRVLYTGDALPAWRCKLRVGDVPWLRDHSIGGEILLPATGYIAMIGEAVRQLTGSTDYSVRNVNFLSPLILGDEPVEIITSLVPIQDAKPSPWYDFSISSLSGEIWTRLVAGQSRGGPISLMPLSSVTKELPRKMSAEGFYYACQRRGLTYGNLFRGLTEISSHTTEGKAKAIVPDLIPISQHTSQYAIHPTALDSCLHLGMVSASRGLERNFTSASVPKFIEEMYITEHQSGAIAVEAETRNSPQRGALTDFIGICNGKVCFQLHGLEVSSYRTNELVDEDPHAGSILEWKADIDFITPARLFNHSQNVGSVIQINRLALACLLETRIELEALEGHSSHLKMLKGWLDRTYEAAVRGTYAGVSDCQELVAMKSNVRQHVIKDILDVCSRDKTVVRDIASRIHWTYSHARAFFSMIGVSDSPIPTNLGSKAQTLEFFHDDVDMADFFTVLTHQNPRLRILQIGAGSGDNLGRLLTYLQSKQKVHLYDSFTVIDPNQETVEDAKRRFNKYPAIEFLTMDMSRDMLSQGCKETFYDLAVISETKFDQETTHTDLLCAVRRLLQPHGRLLIQDFNSNGATIGYLKALESPWWSPDREASIDAWQAALHETGFDGKDTSMFEGVSSSVIVARPTIAAIRSVEKVYVLCRNTTNPYISAFTSFLAATRGIETSFVLIGEELPSGKPIISLLDLEEPFLCDMTPDMFSAFKKSIMSVHDTSMLWVTSACQIECKRPDFALSIGALRTIRHETSADIITLEVDRYDNEAWKAVADLLDNLQYRSIHDESVEPDSEYVFSKGTIMISRFRAARVNDELLDHTHQPSLKRLLVDNSGSPQDVQWVRSEEADLAEHSVEVKVATIAVPEMGCSGYEGNGVVSRIGSQVQLLHTGDQVIFFGSDSCSTRTVVSEAQCVKVESFVSAEAPFIPRTYIQAVYALEKVARLSRGQSLLITYACSTGGLVALNVADIIGAETYCTVANREEAEYICNSCGVSRDRVYYETSSSLQLLNPEGFEVVLNLKAGVNRAKAMNCVAPFGLFIDMIDSDSNAAILQPEVFFGDNRTYVSVDITGLARHRAHIFQSVFARAVELCQQGQRKSKVQIKAFDAASVAQALAYRSSNVKGWEQIVLNMPEDAEKTLHIGASRLQTHLHPDRTYVFVGGLGGLGQAIARFLVEKGARHLIFFSRSAGAAAEKYSDYVKELEYQGCNVQAISGDVSAMDDVRRMIAVATHPIAGVLHAAMVLQDVNFTDMTYEQWQTCVLPKVRGAWNLHNALKLSTKPLDFFFLFSSVSGLGGPVGQANYAAGNAFLDAFVQYRHSLGLPCSVLDIGMMRGIGILEKETYRLEAMRADSLHALHEQDLLDALELMLDRSNADTEQQTSIFNGYTSRGQMAIGMRVGKTLATSLSPASWQRDPRTLLLHKGMPVILEPNHVEANVTSIKEFLQECNANPAVLETDKSAAYLAKEIAAALSAFRMREGEELDLDISMEAIGVDSLLSIELRKWFKQKLGVVYKIHEIRGAESVRALGTMTGRKILQRFQNH